MLRLDIILNLFIAFIDIISVTCQPFCVKKFRERIKKMLKKFTQSFINPQGQDALSQKSINIWMTFPFVLDPFNDINI